MQGQTGAFGKQRQVETVDEAKRVHHEFEGQTVGGDRVLLLNGGAVERLFRVLARLLVAHLPQDALGERQLAVCPGTDAQIVAKAPVVEVVLGFAAGLRERRRFIMPIAAGQARFYGLLHVRGRIVVRHLGRMPVEQGVRLDGEVVGRDMRRRKTDRGIDVFHGLHQRLSRQRVHQVKVYVVEARLGDLNGGARLRGVVDAAERLEMRRVEALDADRQPVDAERAKLGELARLECSRIRFQGDLCIRRELQAGADGRQQFIETARRQKRRCAAAKKHRVDRASPDLRQGPFQVGDQRSDVALFQCAIEIQQRAVAGGLHPFRLMRIEIAIRTLANAPGDVYVEGQRRQYRQRDRPLRNGGVQDLHAYLEGIPISTITCPPRYPAVQRSRIPSSGQ